ncbi:aidB protein [Nannizzia gypsea CBS 118893]|uniref:AidB protein n=1 Tax=Arthroderma gypseum (strain ATCC MYA-4604 / CBS 118893) TaxID=535722 RepID=E4UP08_ARTGP|nr:aidB protein [Nannizzia gypsea CBS 118893]EFQ99761.1 aidB protein [Nannizzia gypsea CBS 118893]
MKASSSTEGFFQAQPLIQPQIEEDGVLRRIISLHLPSPLPSSLEEDFTRFSRLVISKPVLDYAAEAERNQPYLKPLSTFGIENKQDSLVTSEGWRALQDINIREGLVGLAPEPGWAVNDTKWNTRVSKGIKSHLWTPSSAMVTCPGSMTDGAARLLSRHLDGENGQIFAEALKRLTSRDPTIAWTSGQWMTERKGGSDVRGTETVARKLTPQEMEEDAGVDSVGMPLGPWRLDGFKWFSSATDANMSIMLAKTGENSISAFYAPLRRQVQGKDPKASELNGVRIQRLKKKFGTKALPTAELEIKGMRGYLVGKEGQGVKEISTILNITRAGNCIASVGYWGRSLAICRAYSKVRVTSGRLLQDTPSYIRTLARDHVKYAASMHLTFFILALLGISEGGTISSCMAAQVNIIPQDKNHTLQLIRLLTPMAKARTALRAIKGVRASMENLGGIGYLENEDPILNIARIFRDTCVLSIWEGTTEVMADDLMRVVKGRQGPDCLDALDKWVSYALKVARSHSFDKEEAVLRQLWVDFLSDVRSKGREELNWYGRKCLKVLERLVCGCLLILDASRDGDGVAREIARRWILKDAVSSTSWTDEASWDSRIVYGDSSRKGNARL